MDIILLFLIRNSCLPPAVFATLGRCDGLFLIKELVDRFPETRILVISKVFNARTKRESYEKRKK
jgi:hypothetical protein